MSPRAKAAAALILQFFALVLNLAYGLALIAALVFGLYAVGYLMLNEELPPLMIDNAALQVFLVLGVAFALLQHWVAGTASERRAAESLGRLEAYSDASRARLPMRGRGWR